MSDVEFVNLAKISVSGDLQSRLSEAAEQVKPVLEAAGFGVEHYDSIVAVLFIPDSVEQDIHCSAIRKTELRRFVKDLQRTAKNRLPIPESTLKRCEVSLPYGALRVLYISSESCGTMQLLNNEQATSRLRETMAEAEEALSASESAGDALDKVMNTLKHLPRAKALGALLEAEKRLDLDHSKLRDLRSRLTDDVQAVLAKVPDFKDRWARVIERVKKAVIPPDSKSANNVEAVLMAAAYVFDPITRGTGLSAQETSFLIGHFSYNEPVVTKLLNRMSESLRGAPFSGALQDFAHDWLRAGFPKLEVGHKLAATLAMTDAPDELEVMAPWPVWSLVVPPGLFGDSADNKGLALARLWCVGTEVRFLVNADGEIIGPTSRELMRRESEYKDARAACVAMDSLVRGACLALSNPDEYKRQPMKESASKASKKQREGEPDFSVSRFMLSAPVQIDLRQVLLDTLAGKKKHAGGGGSPTVQFFVRGHWRNQAHGPGRALRKTIRIEGFWKGPEEGRVLLRNYKVKDEAQETTSKDTEAEPAEGG